MYPIKNPSHFLFHQNCHAVYGAKEYVELVGKEPLVSYLNSDDPLLNVITYHAVTHTHGSIMEILVNGGENHGLFIPNS